MIQTSEFQSQLDSQKGKFSTEGHPYYWEPSPHPSIMQHVQLGEPFEPKLQSYIKYRAKRIYSLTGFMQDI